MENHGKRDLHKDIFSVRFQWHYFQTDHEIASKIDAISKSMGFHDRFALQVAPFEPHRKIVLVQVPFAMVFRCFGN
jgi:hypothetical protein